MANQTQFGGAQTGAGAHSIFVTPGTSEAGVHLEVPTDLIDTPLVTIVREAIATGSAQARHLASVIPRGGQEVRLEHGGLMSQRRGLTRSPLPATRPIPRYPVWKGALEVSVLDGAGNKRGKWVNLRRGVLPAWKARLGIPKRYAPRPCLSL